MAIATAILASAKRDTHWTGARNSACHTVIQHAAKVNASGPTNAHAMMATRRMHGVLVFHNAHKAVNWANVLRLANALVVPDSSCSTTNVRHSVNVAAWMGTVLRQIRAYAREASTWTRVAHGVKQNAINHV